MTNNQNDANATALPHEEERLGRVLREMPTVEPPKGLAARTLERVLRETAPVRQRFFMLRPITNPLARMAAAACIIFTLVPATNIHMADSIGTKIEEKIMGRDGVTRVEVVLDSVLTRINPSYTQAELDAALDLHGSPIGSPALQVRARSSKSHKPM